MRGTLTLSNYNSAHTSCFTIIIYKSYAVATLQYSRPFISKNYARIVAFAPCSQRASFWGGLIRARTSLQYWEVIISLVSTMCKTTLHIPRDIQGVIYLR
ncbi:hypothetical protein V2W45_1374530 [Cenococcum geophilum]